LTTINENRAARWPRQIANDLKTAHSDTGARRGWDENAMTGRLGIYVINLDRSPERWESISAKALSFGMEIIRIPAIDGKTIATCDYVDVDHKAFMVRGGRRILPGEYGCYRSHMSCISTFLQSQFDVALIMEDDAEPRQDLVERAMAILEREKDADLVKLFNHRSRGFLHKSTSSCGDEIGRCLHGPQGSAACYIVTRPGAEKIARTMQSIAFPYDVAIERGWDHGVRVFTVKSNLISLGALSLTTLIANREEYGRYKIGGPRRVKTHLNRCIEYARRIVFSLSVILA
jgi:glycosyl transferase family 25